MRRVLLLGGTHEGAAAAEALNVLGLDVVTSLAGRTKVPRPPAGRVRVGGFGGVDGLTAYLERERIDLLVDATHPFAERISGNAAKAASAIGLPRLCLYRPAWTARRDDRWVSARSIEHAAELLPPGSKALLALGRQYIAPFGVRSDLSFVVRTVDPFAPPFEAAVLVGRPSPDPNDERAMLGHHAITHVVSRNSGGQGAFAKIEAARLMGLPVIMIDRPPPPAPPLFASTDALVAAVAMLRV